MEELSLGGNFLSILRTSGPVGLAVFLVLTAMSVLSLAVIFAKYVQFSKASAESSKFLELFFSKAELKTINELAKNFSNSPLAVMFMQSYSDVVKMKESFQKVQDLVDVAERNLKRYYIEEVSRLESWLPYLATTASSAPFIGLFGTVVGTMNAFLGLSTAQDTTIQAVAPGIAEALLATAVGLAAAIPASIAYNFFATKLKKLKTQMLEFIEDFKVILRISL